MTEVSNEIQFTHAQDENDISEFLDHCHESFSVPRELFADHWYLDPHRENGGILVAKTSVDSREKIVSSVRVYHRSLVISESGVSVSCGAIGDVATNPRFLRRGLASRLMKDSLTYMKTKGMSVGLLHTDPEGGAFKLYQKCGWVSLPMYVSEYLLETDLLDTCHTNISKLWDAQPCDTNDQNTLEQVSALHREQRGAGYFERSDTYWKMWFQGRTDPRYDTAHYCITRSGTISSYLMVQFMKSSEGGGKDPTVFLCDFLVKGHENENTALVFLQMLRRAIVRRSWSNDIKHFKFTLPTYQVSSFVHERLATLVNGRHMPRIRQDHGWMVILIAPVTVKSDDESQDTVIEDTEDLIRSLTRQKKLFFSRGDKF